MSMLLSRRHALLGALALTPGCAEFSDRSPYWATIRRIVPRGAGMRSAIEQRARELPYASIEVGFGRRAQALMVLEAVNPDGTFDWAGAGGQLISTFGGLVVRVVGLEVDLAATTLGREWRADLREMIGRTATRQLRFRADRIVEIELESRFSAAGEEEVELLAGGRRLLRIDERVASGGRARFANSYWVDPVSGLCLASRQTPVPTAPQMRTRILREPAA